MMHVNRNEIIQNFKALASGLTISPTTMFLLDTTFLLVPQNDGLASESCLRCEELGSVFTAIK